MSHPLKKKMSFFKKKFVIHLINVTSTKRKIILYKKPTKQQEPISSPSRQRYILQKKELKLQLQLKGLSRMLVHNYFGNPWATIFFIATAVFLLALAILQTVFTILSFAKPHT